MATTHSPIFVNFAQDNTTIVRVEKDEDGMSATKIFRSDKANLDDDDKQNLKLLNMCDPYVAEFFFGGQIIIVEGDTEYTAFNYVIQQNPEKYKDQNIHIIRARGKATIKSLVKILNHFQTSYAILHDSDRPTTKTNKKNPAWTMNQTIKDEVDKAPEGQSVTLLASIPNFETACLYSSPPRADKPYNAISKIKQNDKASEIIQAILDKLLSGEGELPQGCLEWNSLDELEQAFSESEISD